MLNIVRLIKPVIDTLLLATARAAAAAAAAASTAARIESQVHGRLFPTCNTAARSPTCNTAARRSKINSTFNSFRPQMLTLLLLLLLLLWMLARRCHRTCCWQVGLLLLLW